MSGVQETISKVLDFFTSGYETADDPIEQLAKEMGASYSVEDNLAKNPDYTTAPINNKKPKKDNVTVFPGSCGSELVVTEPRSFSEDSMQLIKNLQEGRAVVLNLHLLDKEQAQRMVDFISGATQALNGNQQKIGEAGFIFAPRNISITADSMKVKTSISEGIWGQRQY